MSEAALISRSPLHESLPVGSVLIIDDEAEIRESLQTLLELEGFVIETAATGEEGIERDRLDERKGAGEVGAGGGSAVRLCTLGAQSPLNGERRIYARGGKGTNRAGDRATRDHLLQSVQEPDPGGRAGTRDGCSDTWDRQITRLLFRDDLCGFSGRGEPGQRKS